MSEMHRGVQDQLAQLRALQAAAAQERRGQRLPAKAGTTDYVALQDATARAVRRAEDEVRLHFGSSENRLKV